MNNEEVLKQTQDWHSATVAFGLGAGRICRVQVSGGLLCLHTGLSVDSLKDSSVTGIPQPGSWRE